MRDLEGIALTSDIETARDPEDGPLDLSQYCYLHLPDAIVVAALDGQSRLVRHLLDKGTPIDTRDEQGRTALMAAVSESNGYLVSILLDSGADANALDNDGDSPLDVARYCPYYRIDRHNDIIDALLVRGARGKDGPSQKELTDDAIYDAFDHANAVKRLAATVNKQAQKDGEQESDRGSGDVRD